MRPHRPEDGMADALSEPTHGTHHTIQRTHLAYDEQHQRVQSTGLTTANRTKTKGPTATYGGTSAKWLCERNKKEGEIRRQLKKNADDNLLKYLVPSSLWHSGRSQTLQHEHQTVITPPQCLSNDQRPSAAVDEEDNSEQPTSEIENEQETKNKRIVLRMDITSES